MAINAAGKATRKTLACKNFRLKFSWHIVVVINLSEHSTVMYINTYMHKEHGVQRQTWEVETVVTGRKTEPYRFD